LKMKRLFSLDVFRGITIAGMILVNNPGNGKTVYAPLHHAFWNGWTPTDLIFPFFLFIVGVALAFSLSRKRENGERTSSLVAKIFRRSVVLFLLGIFLNVFPVFHFSLSSLRVPGVLQRIAVCYFVSALLFLTLKAKPLALIAFAVLAGYTLLMFLVPVPGYGAGNLTPDGNLAAYLDRVLFRGTHLYRGTWDPEGFLSTFPAVVTTLFGIFAGLCLRSSGNWKKKIILLLSAGTAGVLLGEAVSIWFPINKNIWTSSYVLFTGGLGTLFLAFCFYLCDVLNLRAWAKPFVIFGTNPIAVYFLSGVMAKILQKITVSSAQGATSLYSWIYGTLFEPWAGGYNGSLFFALAYVLFWLGVIFVFYRKKIFIKI
jgi:predicted acyltransferase